MADIKWIKIVTDIFDDEKIRLIDAMPDNDAILVIWFKLLTQAGKSNQNGALFINSKIAYTDEMLATIFNRKLSTVRLALDTFQRLGMIEIGEYIQIANWEKHQNIEGMDKIRIQTRERVAKHREKQHMLAQQSNVTLRNVTVTHLEEELEEELDKEKNKKQGDKSKTKKDIVFFEDVELNKTFNDFIQMRKTKIKNGAMTDRAITMMVNKLNKYDSAIATLMLEQSIINNWKDVYELKDDFKNGKPKSNLAGTVL